MTKPATEYPTPHPLRVFLCHAAEDKTAVRQLYQQLVADNLSPWLDEEDLLPGQNWQQEIVKAVRQSDVVLVCLSQHSLDKQGFVHKEIKLALDVAEQQPENTIFLIPVKLEPCDLPDRLSHLHSVNLFDERGYKKLLRSLQYRASERASQQAAMTTATPAPTPADLPDSASTSELPPVTSDPPPSTMSPATTLPTTLSSLRGLFVLPELLQQGMLRRLCRGSILHVERLNPHQQIIISTGGAALFADNPSPLWDIDCPAQCAAIHPRAGLLALGNRQRIHLWNITNGQVITTLHGHTANITCLAFSPDGTSLISGSSDYTACIWRIAECTMNGSESGNGSPCFTLNDHTDAVRSVAVAPNGRILATGAGNGTVRLWQVDTGERIGLLQGRTALYSLVFSPDSKLLAGGADNGTVRLWQVDDGERLDTLKGQKKRVRSVAFSPDGTMLAAGSDDQSIRLWRVLDGACVQKLPRIGGGIRHLAFADDCTDAGHDTSNDTGLLLTAAIADQTVRVWQIPDGTETSRLTLTNANITSVCFSPDSSLVAAAVGDQTVQIWQTHEGNQQHTLVGHTQTIKSQAFSPDGTLLATGADDETVRVWRVADGTLLHTLRHTDWVRAVAFSPDGTMLAVGSQDVWLWDVATGKLRHTLKRHPDYVQSISFAPDGTTLASGSWNGTVRLWQVANGERLRTLRERDTGTLLRVGFVPDGATLIAVSHDKMVRFWRMEHGVRPRTLKGYKGTLLDVAFSPNGERLAAGCNDGAVRIWHLANGTLLQSLHGHTRGIQSVGYAPASTQGSLLASGSEDGTVRLWMVTEA